MSFNFQYAGELLREVRERLPLAYDMGLFCGGFAQLINPVLNIVLTVDFDFQVALFAFLELGCQNMILDSS